MCAEKKLMNSKIADKLILPYHAIQWNAETNPRASLIAIKMRKKKLLKLFSNINFLKILKNAKHKKFIILN